jgi:hypothetical protein
MKREERREDAQAVLKRLEAQSEKTLSTPAQGEEEADWTERWGKRLGLIIGYGLALFLLWHLYSSYVAG